MPYLRILVCFGVFFLVALGLVILRDGIVSVRRQERKPFDTYIRLMNMAGTSDDYKKRFGEWPDSLREITAFSSDATNWTIDAWGNSVVFVAYSRSSGFGEIISYGRDGRPGGAGVDQDLIVRFPMEANAKWDEKVAEPLDKDPRMEPWSKIFYELYDLNPGP